MADDMMNQTPLISSAEFAGPRSCTRVHLKFCSLFTQRFPLEVCAYGCV